MISIHYSWWLFHKINQKSLNKNIGHKVRTISRFTDTMLKNKVVHLSNIHGKTFEIPPIFFQQANRNFYCKRKQFFLQQPSSLTGEKSPSFASTLPTFIQKVKMVGLPKVTFGIPNPFFFPMFHFSQKNLLQTIKLQQS